MVMRIVSGFILREICGETIAIPSGDSAHCLSGLVALNESGKFLFELLQTEQTIQSLTEALADTYEVTQSTAVTDVQEFLDMLRQCNLLVESA